MICNFSNVAFSVFGFPIHWYSLAYIFGILIALRLSLIFSQQLKTGFDERLFDNFVSVAILGIICGGRLGYVFFYDFDHYMQSPIEIVKIWKGGMSFYGGFLGIIIVTCFFCRNNKIAFFKFIDIWSISVPIGLFLGRIANFINGELPGKASDVSWHVVFRDGIPRHPSQLYEAFLEGIVLFAIMLMAFWKGSYKYEGKLSGIFCTGYGTARFAAEFFREPDSAFSYNLLYSYGLNLNQFISIVMMILGITIVVRSRKRDTIRTFP